MVPRLAQLACSGLGVGLGLGLGSGLGLGLGLGSGLELGLGLGSGLGLGLGFAQLAPEREGQQHQEDREEACGETRVDERDWRPGHIEL